MLVRRKVLVAWIGGLGAAAVSLAMVFSALAGSSTQVPFKVGFAGALAKVCPWPEAAFGAAAHRIPRNRPIRPT